MSDAPPGGQLGKYQIRATLGRGAMGTVYDAMDPVIDRRVAIKTVRLPDANDTEAQEGLARFKREAQAAGRLNHPNIVGVFDYGETPDLAYIVMEFVDGRTLKDLLADDGRLPLAQSLRLMDDVLAGLTYSHERGVVHRDIKPANIIVTREGRAKLADFGIARIESSSMTQAGTVLGTPAYMSPEQFMGQTVDRRTDIYSSGVLLYQLLTGERPFEGGLTAIMHKALNTVPPRPSEFSVTAPPALDPVVARAMARRPDDRYPDATSFGEALRRSTAPAPAQGEDATIVAAPARVPTAQPAPPTPATRPKRPSRTPLIVGAAVTALFVGGIAAWLSLSPGRESAASRQLAAGTGSADRDRVGVGGDVGADGVGAGGAGGGRVDVGAQAGLDVRGSAGVGGAGAGGAGTVGAAMIGTGTGGAGTDGVGMDGAGMGGTGVGGTGAGGTGVGGTGAGGAGTVEASTGGAGAPPPPPRTALAIRAALAASLPGSRCSLVGAEVSEAGSATLTGVVGAGEPAETLRRAVAAAEPRAAQWRVQPFDGPFCRMLDMLRPANQAASRPRAGMHGLDAGQRASLAYDQDMLLDVAMPDFAGHLQVDYIENGGKVSHSAPNAIYPDRTYSANERIEFGRPRGAYKGWQAGKPPGTDLIVVIASTAPLFARARPDAEPLDIYLRDLQAAIDSLRRRGGTLAGDAVVLDIHP